MSRLVVCLNNQIWRHFKSEYDLFRHEFLHALGFGMLYPQVESKKSPEAKIVHWQTALLTRQQLKIYYVDFAERSLEFARTHFNCSKFDAIPSDDSDKFHLDEYYFGVSLSYTLFNTISNSHFQTPIFKYMMCLE